MSCSSRSAEIGDADSSAGVAGGQWASSNNSCSSRQISTEVQTSQHKASDVAGSSGMQQQVSRTEISGCAAIELQRQTDQQGDADESAKS
jgi:hypothetical protein